MMDGSFRFGIFVCRLVRPPQMTNDLVGLTNKAKDEDIQDWNYVLQRTRGGPYFVYYKLV